MNYELDLHTHTLASGHAYNTMTEMAAAAKEAGLKLLGITDHAPAMPGSCHKFHFDNFRIIDRQAYAVPLMLGVELNILDSNGSVDLPSELLEALDYSIASLHPPCVPFMSKADTTNAIIQVMKNKSVHIIGHPDDGRFPLDYETVVKAAKDTHTLLEVNNSSLLPTSFRPRARENYLEMLEYCIKYKVSVVLNSDAHINTTVGRHDENMALLKLLNFPEELVMNTSVEKLKSFLNQ